MLDKGLGPSASEAGLMSGTPEGPYMSKSERLHRWADSLELRKQLQREAIDGATPLYLRVVLDPSRQLASDCRFLRMGLSGRRTARRRAGDCARVLRSI